MSYTSVAAVTRPRFQMIATAFLNLLWRDLWVTMRDWPSFLAMTLLQPVFFLFIFANVLPRLGQTNSGYSGLLLPGIIGLTILLTAMQSVSLPLTIEFGYTKEIEDRLLSPLPVWMVALQKMIFAAIRGMAAGAIILPLGRLIMGSAFSVSTDHLGLLAWVVVMGAMGGAAVGLTLGTFVQPNQIGLMFSLVLTPLLFTGCVYYPWAGLKQLRWFQVVTCFSPLTYTSEGCRAALVPQVPHMAPEFVVLGQIAFLIFFGYLGIRGFLRKAID
ncbi:MAG TPA: ABC transporter permease [Blastocatellia bacterium]|nr:ABC transporter permease [Blastocatellia bacterium]